MFKQNMKGTGVSEMNATELSLTMWILQSLLLHRLLRNHLRRERQRKLLLLAGRHPMLPEILAAS